MLTIAAAAHRHIRLCHGRGEERRNQRHREQQQKRDGDESAHGNPDATLRDGLNEGGGSFRRNNLNEIEHHEGKPSITDAKNNEDVPDQRLGCIRRRAALLPCRIEDNPAEGIGGNLDRCRMAQFHRNAGVGMEPRIIVPDQGHWPRVKRALRRNAGDRFAISGGIRPLHLHLAMMRPIAAAADGQICI